MTLTFSDYQAWAKTIAIYPVISHPVIYPTLGLSDEAGEVSGKIKKIFRDKGGTFAPEDIVDIKKELGDVLWYLSQIATELDISLEEVALVNKAKLESRKDRGVLQGSGDNR